MSNFRLFFLLLMMPLPGAAGGKATAQTSEAIFSQLFFEANVGYFDESVKFVARAGGHALFLKPRELELDIGTDLLRIRIAGASEDTRVYGQTRMPARVNYLIGKQEHWFINVPTFQSVRYERLLPGIDMVVHSSSLLPRMDFHVASAGDPGTIRLIIDGVRNVDLLPDGDVLLTTDSQRVRLTKPLIYQEIGGAREPVGGGYIQHGANELGFRVDDHDARYPLVIDPTLAFSTYLGGSEAETLSPAIAVGADGSAYVGGQTRSLDFPVRAAFRNRNAGALDVYMAKFDPEGGLVYSTYLGGASEEFWGDLAVDADGNLFVTGTTRSSDFPTTPGSFQTVFEGRSAFVAKLNADGDGLIYSTFLGDGLARGKDIALDASGHAYVTGTTGPDFPVVRPFQATHAGDLQDAFVTKLAPDGARLVYSTFLGGSDEEAGNAIAVDRRGAAIVVGWTESADYPTRNALQPVNYIDAFVTKLDPFGSSLVFSTTLGSDSGVDGATDVQVDDTGNVFVVGYADPLFPTRKPLWRNRPGAGTLSFAAKLTADGEMVFSTYLPLWQISAATLNLRGDLYIGGLTSFDTPRLGSVDGLPLPRDTENGALLHLAGNGRRSDFSYHIGGNERDMIHGLAVDGSGAIWATGLTSSHDFPTVRPIQRSLAGGGADAFVLKITDPPAPPPVPPLRTCLDIGPSLDLDVPFCNCARDLVLRDLQCRLIHPEFVLERHIEWPLAPFEEFTVTWLFRARTKIEAEVAVIERLPEGMELIDKPSSEHVITFSRSLAEGQVIVRQYRMRAGKEPGEMAGSARVLFDKQERPGGMITHFRITDSVEHPGSTESKQSKP